ncbi:hypothetical protein FB384_004887 [Prauserella sediminis]|uniref:Holin n=1 Tax=Prauserella sediminis TaxID=577680 RepID=A0A839XXY1_9PSEU|nr:holin [Prauserella sediminis]MBB3665928.1 hypothetical protein [Prauserella sediminis]
MTNYFKDLGERVVSSFTQGALSVLGLDAMNVLTVDWTAALGVGGGAAVLALLKALAGRGVGQNDNAAVTPSVARKE